MSLSSPDFNGRDARVLFDFSPETEYEIELKAGQIIWVQYRQCPVSLFAEKWLYKISNIVQIRVG